MTEKNLLLLEIAEKASQYVEVVESAPNVDMLTYLDNVDVALDDLKGVVKRWRAA